MPTIEWRGVRGNQIFSRDHFGAPWIITGDKTPGRRRITPVAEETSADIDTVPLSFLIGRLILGTEHIGPLVPLSESDQALVGVTPSSMVYDAANVEKSVFVTFPDEASWHGVTINAAQWVESPSSSGSGFQWLAGASTGIVGPGPFSRDGRVLTFSTIGSYAERLVASNITAFEWDFNGSTQTIPAIPYTGFPNYARYSRGYLTREFPNSLEPGGPIRVRGITSDGAKTAWCKIKYHPIASAVAEQQDETLLLDGTESFDPDGSIVEWEWTVRGYGPFVSDTPTMPVPFEDIPIDWQEGTIANINLRVKDNDGLYAYGTTSFVYSQTESVFGFILDATGTSFSAVNDGNNVQVYRFPEGASSRESRSQILNAKNPSYAIDDRNTHFVSYENRTTGTQEMRQSIDGGRTWQ